METIKTLWKQHGHWLVSIGFLALAVGLALHAKVTDPHGLAAPLGMAAVSVTNILAGTNTFIGDVIATADGDTTATITHGLSAGGTPKEIQITKILSVALAADPGWSAAAPGATTVVCTKLATVGSGNASAQLRVTVKTPHSIGA